MIELKQNLDWVNSAGIIGYLRVQGVNTLEDLNNFPDWDGEKLFITGKSLEGFEKKYFSYMAKKYSNLSYLTSIKMVINAYNSAKDDTVKEKIILGGMYKGLGEKASSFFKRKGVQSAVKRYDEENGTNIYNEEMARATKPIKKKSTVVAWDSYVSNLSMLLKHLGETGEKYIREIEVINSYISKFLGKKYTFTAGLNKTKYFEKSYRDSVLKYVNEYLEDYESGKYKKYQYKCSFCGSPMRDYKSPSSTGAIITRSSSNLEGAYYNTKSSIGYFGQPDEVACPICSWLLSLVPAGLLSVGHRSVFVNNAEYGIKSLLPVNNMLEYLMESESKPTYGKAIRDLIKSKYSQEGKGSSIISISDGTLGDMKIDNVSLSEHDIKRLHSNSKIDSLINLYYIDKSGSLTNAFEAVVENINNLKGYTNKLIQYSISSPDKFKFDPSWLLKAVLTLEDGSLEDKKLFGIGYHLADDYVKVTGNKNKVNGIIYKLVKAQNNKERAIDIITRVYAYANRSFNYTLWKSLRDDQTFSSTLNAVIVGIMSYKEGESNEK